MTDSSSPQGKSTSRTILGAFPVDRFLSDHWQKQLLFLSGALNGFVPPVGADELAGLACEEEFESRLVLDAWETDSSGSAVSAPWKLRHGPFKEDEFSELAEAGWTLLVQDVDKFLPEVADLLSLVSFLPKWSVDDVMISFAAPGGSVGPHADQYDVFLLQAAGTRRWQVSDPGEATELRDDSELSVLRRFEAEETFVARPGDVLYLPPGVAHYGIAEDDCLTYSFGFRAPSEATLLSAFADDLVSRAGESLLRESLANAVPHPARLSAELLSTVRRTLASNLSQMTEDGRWLGRMLTSPKPHISPGVPGEVPVAADLLATLEKGGCLVRNPGSRFLFIEESAQVVLFVDGEEHDLTAFERASDLAAHLSEGAFIDDVCLRLIKEKERPELGALLSELVAGGALGPSHTA
ncbi:MAG: 50S ribosomal protein L16 3-hydroxylase [Hyphomicrobiaceae bacterium]|jgi:50S ribosomal protein L16 3-hydroxylase